MSNNVIWSVKVEDKADDSRQVSYWIHGGTLEQAAKKGLALAKKWQNDNIFNASRPSDLRVCSVAIAGTIDG